MPDLLDLAPIIAAAIIGALFAFHDVQVNDSVPEHTNHAVIIPTI